MTGQWAAVLVGPWMPIPPTELNECSRHWAECSAEQEAFAGELSREAERLARNEGVTAEDLITQHHDGSRFHLDLAEKYSIKAAAFREAAAAVDGLIQRLDGIAAAGVGEINKILASASDPITKDADIEAVEARSHGDAAAASASAAATVVEAIGKILRAEGIDEPPREWVRANGFERDQPPVAAQSSSPALSDLRSSAPHVYAAAALSDVRSPQPAAPAASAAGAAPAAVADVRAPAAVVPHGGTSDPRVLPDQPGGPSIAVGSGHGPGIQEPVIHGPEIPPADRGGFSPVAAFTEGAAAGRPAAAGAQAVAASAVQSSAPVHAATTPLATSPMAPMVGGVPAPAAEPHSAAEPAAASASVIPLIPPAPLPVAGPVPPISAPALPAVPPPLLPAYGADIRSAPVAPVLPASGQPLGGTPVAAATTPAAGSSPAVAAVRPAAVTSPAPVADGLAARATAAATAGAAAGQAATEASELERLERLVAAVARQAPALTWAAGLRDDGTTRLVTDLFGGWIPPNVVVPAGVVLLEPATRRPGSTPADLLGACSVMAEHHSRGYVSPAHPDDPPLTDGPRTGPPVAELGPALVDLSHRVELERIVGLAARQVTRGGLADAAEMDRLHAAAHAIQDRVMAHYPAAAASDVAAWMLTAAVVAFIGSRPRAGRYHLAWATTTLAGRRP